MASGAVFSNGSRGSITAFTGSPAALPFTASTGEYAASSPTPGWANRAYAYDPDHPHAVSSLSTGNSYTYDDNGNMVSRTEIIDEVEVLYTQAFDAENRLTSVTKSGGGGVTSFKYDGNGNLIAKLVGTVATYYLGGVLEVEVTDTTVTKTTTYYPIGGAMRVEDPVADTSILYYVLKDHLGSASIILDSSGDPIANGEQRYYPFGESRTSSTSLPTDRLFTGQKLVADIGLYHYGARFYDPHLNRMIQPDSIVPDFTNPQSLNRYSYVNNNPINYTDPMGHTSCPAGMGAACSNYNNWIGATTCAGGMGAACSYSQTASRSAITGAMKTESIQPTSELTSFGAQAQANLETLSQVGGGLTDQELLAFVVVTEYVGPIGPDARMSEAMARRYRGYCSNGSRSASCLNNFWGYIEGILNNRVDLLMQWIDPINAYWEVRWDRSNDIANAIISRSRNRKSTRLNDR